MMIDMINNILKEGCIDWGRSTLVYIGNGDALVCGSYIAIRLLEQPMNVLGSVLEKSL